MLSTDIITESIPAYHVPVGTLVYIDAEDMIGRTVDYLTNGTLVTDLFTIHGLGDNDMVECIVPPQFKLLD